MTYTADDLKNELMVDGLQVNGEPAEIYELWWESSVGDKVETLTLGDFEIVEHVVGKAGDVEYMGDYGANVWNNYIILKQNDRYFRLPGEYDSWDAKGWTGEVEEVEQVEKTITVWENKNDY